MRLPARIHVRLLGGFEIALDDTLPIRLSTKKVCGLVAFLVTNRKQAATREELATLLWGSCSDQQARQSLRQALLLLRKDLGSTTALASDKEVIRLQPRMWSADSLDFEKLAASGTLADAERAAELYHGDFLAGLSIDEEGFEEWLQAQRSRLQMAAGRVLAICAERRDAAGNGPGAIAAAERLLTLDPLREDWQRLVLRLTARYHGQHEALARATEFEALLRRELDVDPEPETAALIAKIGRGDIVRASAATGEAITHRIEAEGPASAFRAAGAQPDAGTALPAALLPRRRWQAPRLTSGRGIAAGSAIALLALTGAALTWTHGGKDHAGKHPVEAVVTAPDPWQAPSLTARPVVAAMSLARAAITPIAVLPFVPYGESAGSMQLTADMITDDLVNMLSRVPGLRVISRQTSRSYQGQSVDVAVIGRELGVRYVLEGSVRRNDDKLRINVELVEAESRLQAWSGRIERADADREGVLDEIVGRLARELQFEVAHAEGQRSSRKPGVEELIFKGWAALYGAATPGAATFRKAEAYFTRALERDPDNVRARIGLAGYHVSFQFHATDAAPHLAKAEEILLEVIRSHPGDSDAYYYMGLIQRVRGSSKEAIEWYERATTVNPSHAPSYSVLGHALARLGRAGEGLEYVRYAMRLSPRDPALAIWLRNAGEAELELGHHDQAIEYFRRSLTLHPNHAYPLAGLVAAYALSGRMDEARRYLAELRNAAPHQSDERLLERFAGDHGRPELRLVAGLRRVLQP